MGRRYANPRCFRCRAGLTDGHVDIIFDRVEPRTRPGELRLCRPCFDGFLMYVGAKAAAS